MDRRKFLRAGVVGSGVAASSALAAPAYAQGKRTLIMVTTWPRGAAGLADAAEKAAENINSVSDTLTVEVRHAGELVGAFEAFDAVTAGQADMYHATDYYWINQHPAFAFYTAVPFGMTATELNNWYYHDGGMEMHHQLGEIFGLKAFLSGNTGAQAGGWYRKPINSAEDFQGLKFRMPGLGGRALGYMGASVQNLPGGEIYQALASGAIDGTEWVGPWADEKAGFQEIAQYYYPAGFHEPASGQSLATNLDVWNELTPQQQKAIEVSAAAADHWSLSQYFMNNGSALQRLAGTGTQVMEFPEEVWDAFGTASQQVYDEFMDDEIFKETFDAYRKSLASSSGWLSQSVSVYREQRDRVLSI